MNLRRSLAALVVAHSLLLSTSALAAGPSAADRATARALAAEAHRAFDAKDYVTAAERFARADALVHAPTLMLGLARAQAALGKIVAANESLNRIIREDLPADVPKVWLDAVEEARKELAVVAPRLSWITVNVKGATGHEEDLHVILDGVEVPSAAIGLPRAVDAGAHLVVATMARSTTKAEGSAKLEEGKSATISLEVKWVPPPVAQVTVPVAPQGPGQSLPPPVVPVSPLRKNLGIAAVAVGGAGLVVGAVTGGLVLSMHSTLAAACKGGQCPRSEQSKLDSYNTMGAVSTAGFIGGAVFAGLGIVLVATAPKTPKPTVGLQVIPTIGGGTLSAAGSF